MKKTTDNFARALTMLRDLYGMKISEIAALSGITPATINKIEHNISNPSVNTFKRITQIFEISPDTLFQILKNENALSNSQMLISLKPGKYSEIIDASLSYARVAKIIRILKNIPYMTAALENTETTNKLSSSTVYSIEKLKKAPSIKTIKHLCLIYDISLEKYFYFVKSTSSMTTIEAAIFIAMDFES